MLKKTDLGLIKNVFEIHALYFTIKHLLLQYVFLFLFNLFFFRFEVAFWGTRFLFYKTIGREDFSA